MKEVRSRHNQTNLLDTLKTTFILAMHFLPSLLFLSVIRGNGKKSYEKIETTRYGDGGATDITVIPLEDECGATIITERLSWDRVRKIYVPIRGTVETTNLKVGDRFSVPRAFFGSEIIRGA